MAEAEILPIIMERLRAQNPTTKIPEGSAAWLKNWGSDPLFYGAYSYSAPDTDYSSAWKKPLKACKKEVVQFAGEATCDNMNGYTHGALQSGKEAAARYLYQVGKGPNPNSDDALSLCSW
jgi:monoamine oxidase